MNVLSVGYNDKYSKPPKAPAFKASLKKGALSELLSIFDAQKAQAISDYLIKNADEIRKIPVEQIMITSVIKENNDMIKIYTGAVERTCDLNDVGLAIEKFESNDSVQNIGTRIIDSFNNAANDYLNKPKDFFIALTDKTVNEINKVNSK